MQPRDNEDERLFKQCQEAMAGPLPSVAGTDVMARVKADGLSLPAIATAMRRWALHQDDVLRIVLGHTSKRYTLAILLSNSLEERAFEARTDVQELDRVFGGLVADFYVLGPRHVDAKMFYRPGSYEIYAGQNRSAQDQAA